MSRDIVPASQNSLAGSRAPVSETFCVGGIQTYAGNLKKLARANPDWNLSPAEIIAAGKAGRNIYKIKFTNSPVKFAPVPESPGQTYLTIAGETVGILSSQDTARIKTIFSSFDTQRVSCTLRGGLYKIVDSHGNVETQQQGFSISLKITYVSKGAPVQSQAISALRSASPSRPDRSRTSPRATATRAAKVKKPFYKRWWFWTIIALLVLGSFGSTEEVAAPATIPTIITGPSEAPTIATEEYIPPASTVPATAAPVIPTDPPVVPTDPPVVPTSAPPVTEPEKQETTYILNTNSHKFHYPSCSSADDIKESNKATYTGTREEVITKGYDPCKRCNP